jgi:hypothetical protein
MAHGLWLMAYGLWLMAYGLWLMAYGLWLMAYGLKYDNCILPGRKEIYFMPLPATFFDFHTYYYLNSLFYQKKGCGNSRD